MKPWERYREQQGPWSKYQGDSPRPQQPQELSGAELVARETGPVDAALIGVGRGFDQLRRGIGNLLMPGTPFDDPFADQAYAALQQQHPLATGIGESAPYMVGGLGAGAMLRGGGLLANLGAQAATAGGIGAAQPGTASERLQRGAIDAAIGAAGEGLGRGFGRMLAPRFGQQTGRAAEIIRTAEDQGYKVVPRTRARGSGRFAQTTEGWLESTPGGAVALGNLAEHNQRILNRAAAKAVGETGDALDETALAAADKRIGDQLDKLMSPDLKIPVTKELNTRLASIYDESVQPYIASTPDAKGALKRAEELIVKHEDAGIPADVLQKQISRLGKVAKRNMAENPDLGHALYDIQDVLLDAAKNAMSPEDAKAFTVARRQYRDLMTLQSGVHILDTTTGDVSASNLATALRRRDKAGFARGGRNDALYTGARLLGRMQKPLPTSHTPARQFLTQALLGGSGGAYGATQADDPLVGFGLGLMGGAMAPYALARLYGSPVANRALTRIPGVTEQAATRAAGLGTARGLMAPLLPQDQPTGLLGSPF